MAAGLVLEGTFLSALGANVRAQTPRDAMGLLPALP